MKAGLEATFQFLVKTENEAAIEVLVAALECPHRGIRDRAVRSLLARPSPRGHVELFRRLSGLEKRCWSILSEPPDRLVRAARNAFQAIDKADRAAAFGAVVSLRLYDVIPALVTLLKDERDSSRQSTAQTIRKLTELFYRELCRLEHHSEGKRLSGVRQRISFALEKAVGRFNDHRCTEVIEALVLVAKPQNATLRRILRQPGERSREALVDVLSNSSHGGVIRLLLGFLEDPYMPYAVKKILSTRTDPKFVENLLRKTGPKPSRSVAKTLKRFDLFTWARRNHPLFDKLNSTAQQNAVQVFMASSMDRSELFDLLRFLLLQGKPGGRRAAAEALAEFDGPEADALVIETLKDDDPLVRAHLIRQVRSRRIPGRMSLLIQMVDSPHEEVRAALRDALPEFTLEQFMANFDSIPEELLPTAGHLVRRIDVGVQPKLTDQMGGLSPVRRRRAVLAAGAMGLVQDVEEAAKALAGCETMPSWDALSAALFDRSVIVQEAAEQSLNRISQSLLEQVEEESEEMVS
jgi:HEAT repeat protein